MSNSVEALAEKVRRGLGSVGGVDASHTTKAKKEADAALNDILTFIAEAEKEWLEKAREGWTAHAEVETELLAVQAERRSAEARLAEAEERARYWKDIATDKKGN